MSLHYLLDGYNILKQVPAFNDLSLEDGRKGLIGWIESARPQGSVNNTVTIVFDSPRLESGGGSFGAFPQGSTRVIFSQGCADDKIKLMAEEDDNRRNCVVVSDDKDIVLYVRALGSRVMSVAKFTESLRTKRSLSKLRPKKAHKAGSKADGKYISLSRQEKINKELSRIWLKEGQ